jgi:hypothetical protein
MTDIDRIEAKVEAGETLSPSEAEALYHADMAEGLV